MRIGAVILLTILMGVRGAENSSQPIQGQSNYLHGKGRNFWLWPGLIMPCLTKTWPKKGFPTITHSIRK